MIPRRTRLQLQLDATAQLMTSFARRAPAVLELLRITAPDGYQTSTLGDGGTSSSSSSTERAVEARLRHDHAADWALIHSAIESVERAAVALHAGLAACDRHQRPDPADTARQRCSGGMGQPGALDWGRPDCTNIAAGSRGGLCDACRKRRDRWKRHGAAA